MRFLEFSCERSWQECCLQDDPWPPIVSELSWKPHASLTAGTPVHRVGRLGPVTLQHWQLGRSLGSMRWLKRVGLAGVIFFTVKGLIWLGVALLALVLAAD